jgi:hypothetical protein
MKRVCLALSLVLILVGCAGRINRVMNSWVGQHYSALIASWGPPEQILPDGSGGNILSWTVTRSFSTPGSATTQTTGTATVSGNTASGQASSYTIYNPPRTYTRRVYRAFWVNSDGIVYKWAWRGL